MFDRRRFRDLVIGVRCHLNPNGLHFELRDSQGELLKGNHFATDHFEVIPPGAARHPFNEVVFEANMSFLRSRRKLTDLGAKTMKRVVGIVHEHEERIEWLSARPAYFDLNLSNNGHWPLIMPEVVRAIRELTRKDAPVMARRSNPGDKLWHEELVNRLPSTA